MAAVQARLDRFNWAIAEGDREQSYGLFLGLDDDEANRERLKERLLFAGIIDLQDTLINRGGYQNIGHKALRARALIDIADYFGWDNAREVIYTVVPDLGCSPRLYGLWNEISSLVKLELPDAHQIAKRTEAPMSERYELHRTETCDRDAPRRITHVETTPATTPNWNQVAPIHAALAGRELLPGEHLLDAGYVDGEAIVRGRATTGWRRSGRCRQTAPGRRRPAGASRWRSASATCAGRATSAWPRPDCNTGSPPPR